MGTGTERSVVARTERVGRRLRSTDQSRGLPASCRHRRWRNRRRGPCGRLGSAAPIRSRRTPCGWCSRRSPAAPDVLRTETSPFHSASVEMTALYATALGTEPVSTAAPPTMTASRAPFRTASQAQECPSGASRLNCHDDSVAGHQRACPEFTEGCGPCGEAAYDRWQTMQTGKTPVTDHESEIRNRRDGEHDPWANGRRDRPSGPAVRQRRSRPTNDRTLRGLHMRSSGTFGSRFGFRCRFVGPVATRCRSGQRHVHSLEEAIRRAGDRHPGHRLSGVPRSATRRSRSGCAPIHHDRRT